jgi:hypothetical protein
MRDSATRAEVLGASPNSIKLLRALDRQRSPLVNYSEVRAAFPLALEDGEPAAGRLPPRTAALAIASAGWCFAVATLLPVALGWPTTLSLSLSLALELAAAFPTLF